MLLGMPGVTGFKIFSSLSVEVTQLGHSTSVPGDHPVGGREGGKTSG